MLELEPVLSRSYNRLIEPVKFKPRTRQFNASDGTHMTSYFVDLKPKQAWLRPARLATVSLAVVIASGDHIDAASRRNEPSVSSVESRTAGEPIMAIVSLRDQRITVYDKNGWGEATWAPVGGAGWRCPPRRLLPQKQV